MSWREEKECLVGDVCPQKQREEGGTAWNNTEGWRDRIVIWRCMGCV